jgi:signal transduction histidine kinase
MFHREHGVRDALLQLARELGNVTDVHGVARVLTRGLVDKVPLRSAGLYLPDRVDRRFRVVERYVAPNDDVHPPLELVDETLIEWLAARRDIFTAEDEMLHAGTGLAAVEVARALNAANVALAVPIVEDDALSAVVLVGEKRSGAAFSPDELDLLTAVAANAAIALRNARLYDDLRRRIEDVRAAHQQLSQSAKLAAIGELAASVAHEVNNPLMVIFGYTARLRRELPEAMHTRLDAIEEQTHRAAKILRRLLDFARRREPALVALDIREVLVRSLELVGGRLARSGVVIDGEVLGDISRVIGDRDQLTQVFVNLFNNALDAMPDGGTLRLRTEVRSADEIPCLTVSVADTGVGIGADELKSVFQPFYTTKPDGKGTGLGLSISLGIVRRHEGTIEVVSERGKGSTFFVSLPIAR